MANEYQPRIGDWYQNINSDRFEVVALDEEETTMEIQYFDGAIEEIDFDSWNEMEIKPIEPPEDWTGSMDVDREDSQAPEIWTETEDWMRQLERLDNAKG